MGEVSPDRARLDLAKGSLIGFGYFTAAEVDDDVAPRIHELVTAIEEVKFLPWHRHPENEPCLDLCPGYGLNDAAVLAAMIRLLTARRRRDDAQTAVYRAEQALTTATCSTCKGTGTVGRDPCRDCRWDA